MLSPRLARIALLLFAALCFSNQAMAWLTGIDTALGPVPNTIDSRTAKLAAKAPRDKDGVVVIPWWFDPSYPFDIQNPKKTPQQANEILRLELEKGMRDWESACNIRFEYKGEKSTPFKDPYNIENATNAYLANPNQDLYISIYGDPENHRIPFIGRYDSIRTIYISGYDASRLLLDFPRSSGVGILTHELGHALGLGHSNDEFSVMADHIPLERGVFLRPDDIAGCQAIYGQPKNVSDDVKAENLFNIAEMAYPDFFPIGKYEQSTNPGQATRYVPVPQNFVGTYVGIPGYMAAGPYVKAGSFVSAGYPSSAILDGYRFRRYNGPILPLRYFNDLKFRDDYYSKLYPGYKTQTGWVDTKECPKGFVYLAVKAGDVYYYNDASPQDGIIKLGRVDDVVDVIRNDRALLARESSFCNYLQDTP